VDLITLGKPVGNGHPLGVVLTRRAVAGVLRAVRVFSTFGGNSVACAAGQAVLDVIAREDLLTRANRIGDLLRAQLRDLAQAFPLIGDVRGRGMLTGLEFTSDPAARTPAPRRPGAWWRRCAKTACWWARPAHTVRHSSCGLRSPGRKAKSRSLSRRCAKASRPCRPQP
jgi:4-aminobutyrate aminotransferase-like enzyme